MFTISGTKTTEYRMRVFLLQKLIKYETQLPYEHVVTDEKG